MDGMYFLCNNGMQIAGRATTCLLKNKTEKKSLGFWKNPPILSIYGMNFVNAVLRVSRRKKLRNTSLRGIFFCLVD